MLWIYCKIGRAEGHTEGHAEATLDSLRKLMQKQHMTAEEALDFLDVPKEERKSYIAKLLSQ